MNAIKVSTVGVSSVRNFGAWGGAIDGGVSIYKNIRAVHEGRKSTGEATWSVAKDTAGGVLSGVGSAAAYTAVGSVFAGTVLLPLTAAAVAGVGISALYHSLAD